MGAYVWYIEGSNPKVLIDAGASIEGYQARKLKQEHIQSLEEGLAKLGVSADDIGIVILTHLHWDHCAFSHKFTKAKFIVQKAELDFGLNPHPANASAYTLDYYKDLNIEVVDNEDKEIVEGVRVLFAPGHTPGTQSVAVETAKGLAIIAGFCGTADNFEPPPELKARGAQIIPCGLHVNLFQSYDSTLRIKQEADIIVPLHDAKFLDEKSIP